MTNQHRAIIMLGGNVGDTVCVFESTIRTLVLNNINLISASSIYRTKPWGYFDQRDFLNQLLVLETNMDLFEFHECCLKTELLHGKNKVFENLRLKITNIIWYHFKRNLGKQHHLAKLNQ